MCQAAVVNALGRERQSRSGGKHRSGAFAVEVEVLSPESEGVKGTTMERRRNWVKTILWGCLGLVGGILPGIVMGCTLGMFVGTLLGRGRWVYHHPEYPAVAGAVWGALYFAWLWAKREGVVAKKAPRE